MNPTEGDERADPTTRPDGGAAESDRAAAFRTESDFAMTRGDQIREIYDQRFYAPMQILLRDYRGILGLTIVGGYLLMATVGVQVVAWPHQSPDRLLPWFQELSRPLGTDSGGRDLVSMVVHATPRMLQLMFAGALFSTMLGVVIGLVSGYKMGVTDRILMTITDTVMTLPGLPLLIVLVAVLQPTNPFLIGVILSLNAWAGTSRSLRSQVLQIRSEDHVEAARAMGVSTGRNIQKNVLPQLLPLITIGFMNTAVAVLYAAVGLYYLNILPVDFLNWGVMLDQAESEVNFATMRDIHYLMVPLIVISLIGFGMIMLAQAFDRVFNPRLRAKHAKTIRGGDEGDADESTTADAAALEAMAR